MKTPFDYTLKEWMDHLRYFYELSLREPTTVGAEEVVKYFPAQYPNPEEAHYKSERFVASQTYLEEHMDEFEAAGYALASSQTANTSHHVMIALYRFYSHAPDETIYGKPPSIQFMLNLTREAEESAAKRRDELQ